MFCVHVLLKEVLLLALVTTFRTLEGLTGCRVIQFDMTIYSFFFCTLEITMGTLKWLYEGGMFFSHVKTQILFRSARKRAMCAMNESLCCVLGYVMIFNVLHMKAFIIAILASIDLCSRIILRVCFFEVLLRRWSYLDLLGRIGLASRVVQKVLIDVVLLSCTGCRFLVPFVWSFNITINNLK